MQTSNTAPFPLSGNMHEFLKRIWSSSQMMDHHFPTQPSPSRPHGAPPSPESLMQAQRPRPLPHTYLMHATTNAMLADQLAQYRGTQHQSQQHGAQQVVRPYSDQGGNNANGTFSLRLIQIRRNSVKYGKQLRSLLRWVTDLVIPTFAVSPPMNVAQTQPIMIELQGLRTSIW